MAEVTDSGKGAGAGGCPGPDLVAPGPASTLRQASRTTFGTGHKPRTPQLTMPETSGSGRSQADKERSKQMSRSVSGDQAQRNGRVNARPAQGGPRRSDQRSSPRPAGRSQGNGRQSAPSRSPARPRGRRSPTVLATWGTAALVVVIVVVLVAFKVFGGSSSPQSGPQRSLASPDVVAQVTNIPASVYDTVGITSNVAPIYPPIVISGQPPLTFTGSAGKPLPGVFFFGAEYCPHCAAQRWAIIAALSRFGTFHNLANMQSSSTDVDPNTQSFSFYGSTYTSSYIAFRPVEYLSNQWNSATNNYEVLQQPTKEEWALEQKYNSPTYFPSLTAGEVSFPFLNFGNRILSQENYDPSILQGLSREEIASGLKSAKSPITQAIVASANYLSASVCEIDGQQPGNVCMSSGVQAAAKALKLG